MRPQQRQKYGPVCFWIEKRLKPFRPGFLRVMELERVRINMPADRLQILNRKLNRLPLNRLQLLYHRVSRNPIQQFLLNLASPINGHQRRDHRPLNHNKREHHITGNPHISRNHQRPRRLIRRLKFIHRSKTVFFQPKLSLTEITSRTSGRNLPRVNLANSYNFLSTNKQLQLVSPKEQRITHCCQKRLQKISTLSTAPETKQQRLNILFKNGLLWLPLLEFTLLFDFGAFDIT